MMLFRMQLLIRFFDPAHHLYQPDDGESAQMICSFLLMESPHLGFLFLDRGSLRPGSVKLSASYPSSCLLFCRGFLVPIQGLLFCVYIIAYCTERVNRLKVFFNHFYCFRQYDEKMFFYKNRLAADCRHFIQIKLQRISIIFLK